VAKEEEAALMEIEFSYWTVFRTDDLKKLIHSLSFVDVHLVVMRFRFDSWPLEVDRSKAEFPQTVTYRVLIRAIRLEVERL
jgi:hypothetical protein